MISLWQLFKFETNWKEWKGFWIKLRQVFRKSSQREQIKMNLRIPKQKSKFITAANLCQSGKSFKEQVFSNTSGRLWFNIILNFFDEYSWMDSHFP